MKDDEIQRLLARIDSGIQSLGDLFNRRMDAIERQVLRRYAPLPPNHHCPKCGAALSQGVSDWRWLTGLGAWMHDCGGRMMLVNSRCDCAQPDSEPLKREPDA